MALAIWLANWNAQAERRRLLNEKLRPFGLCILGGDCLTGNVMWSIEGLRPRA